MKRKSSEMVSPYQQLRDTLLEREKIFEASVEALENCLEVELNALIQKCSKPKRNEHHHVLSTIPPTIFEETECNVKSEFCEPIIQTSTRPRRQASQKASEKINEQANAKLNVKLRRDDIIIKTEKIETTLYSEENIENVKPDTKSEAEYEFKVPTRSLRAKKIKKEKVENEEPKRQTRSRAAKNQKAVEVEEVVKRTSSRKKKQKDDDDIIEVENKISLIYLSSDEDIDQPTPSQKGNTTKEKSNGSKNDKTTDGAIDSNHETLVDVLTKKTESISIGKINIVNKEPIDKNTKVEELNDNEYSNEIINATYTETKSTEEKQIAPLEISNASVYEDAVEDNKSNNTVSIPKEIVNSEKQNNAPVMDTTYCKESEECVNETFVMNKSPDTNTTDNVADETFVLKQKSPVKEMKQLMKTQMLSPGIAAKVAQFEKLTKNDPPLRITRSKMKALPKIDEMKKLDNTTNSQNTTSSSLDTNKIVWTPSVNSTPFLFSSSSCKASAKIGRVELQEKREAEQRIRSEKKEEVQRKKEAMLQAKTEEQRRKREEKLLKVQHAREAKEKERQRAMEKAEKEKEERNRQLQAEREEQMKREIQRKRALAAQRAAEIEDRRKAEEAARLARIQEQEEAERRAEAQRKRDYEEAERLHQKRLEEERAEHARAKLRAQKLAALKAKQQMKLKTGTSTPVPVSKIPTSNYIEELNTDDSTDDESSCKRVIPDWCQSANRKKNCRIQDEIPVSVINKFFSIRPMVISLSDIFDNVDKRLLRRNSSAVWRTPPRYSQVHRV